MPRAETLQGFSCDVLDVEPSAITDGKPGKSIVLVDKNFGDAIIYTIDNDEAARIATKLQGIAVRAATELETAVVLEAHRGGGNRAQRRSQGKR